MKKLEEFDRGKLLKDLGALLFVLFVIFLLISLITYSEGDVPGAVYPLNDLIQNKGGLIGAQMAGFLLQHFGLCSYLIILFIGIWSFQVFFRRHISGIYFKFLTAAICVLAMCGMLSLQGIFNPGFFGFGSATVSLGGVYGEAVKIVSVKTIGGFGSWIFFSILFGISLILATDWIAYKMGLGAVGLCKNAVKAIRARAAKRRLRGMYEEQKKQPVEQVEDVSEPVPQPVAKETPKQDIVQPQTLEPARVVPIAALPKPVQEKKPVVKKMGEFRFPSLELFEDHVERIHKITEDDIKVRRDVIQASLAEYGVNAKVVGYEVGPTVTLYELELSPGTRISKIASLSDELAMKLMVPNVRIIAPIPGRGTVGVEVPNPFPDTVRLHSFLKDGVQEYKKIALPVFLGKNNSGESLVKNLAEMPHILIAGTTGSGKSVCLKSIVMGLVSTKKPTEMKLLLIDPKMVELTAFEDIPHLWAPVITDPKKASLVLDWLVKEMETRYSFFNKLRVMKIDTFNQLGEGEIKKRLKEIGMSDEEIEKIPTYMPYIVVVVDELADLMLVSGKEVEGLIIRISQKARAVGIHLVAATQRPSADVVTGLIKSNMPSRISFKVASHIESRIILDHKGAERLLGKGDMLVLLPSSDTLLRSQCTFTGEEEIKRVVDFLKSTGEPIYHNELVEIDHVEDIEGTQDDEMFNEALKVVLESRRGSISLIQRRLGIGYQRAARLMESMEKLGLVGPYNGANPREVLMTHDQWQAKKKEAK